MDDEPFVRRHLLPLLLIAIVATTFSGWLLYKRVVPFWLPLAPLPTLLFSLLFAGVFAPPWRVVKRAWRTLQSALEKLKPESD